MRFTALSTVVFLCLFLVGGTNAQVICPAVYAPVCGINGITYSNTCSAGSMKIACEGECPCPRPTQCFCITPAIAPVCGVDGTTYSNTCLADCAGVEIACNGECPCGPPADCICTEEFFPVCGVDGTTYSNPCFADCAGVEIACNGECPCGPPADCICTLEFAPVCGVDGTTYSNACSAGCASVEINCNGKCPCDALCSCAPSENPVCGVDGKQYGNGCLAGCAGVEVDCKGQCPCKKGCSCNPNPVCGVDGVTYLNKCRARKAAVKIECNNACPCKPVLPCERISCANPCADASCPAYPNAQCIAAGQCGCSATYISNCEVVDCSLPPPTLPPFPINEPPFCQTKGQSCVTYAGVYHPEENNCCPGLQCCADCPKHNNRRGSYGYNWATSRFNKTCRRSCPKCY